MTLAGRSPDPHEPYPWAMHAARTLTFLYGVDHATARAAKTAQDLAAWRSLGEPKGRVA